MKPPTFPTQETFEEWLEIVGELKEPKESISSAIERHLGDSEPMPTPPNPPRMIRVREGRALDVAEQLGYAIAALGAQGVAADDMQVTCVDGTIWVHTT